MQKRIKSEPMISVKEEANDKQFDEFTENFVQKVPTTSLYKFSNF